MTSCKNARRHKKRRLTKKIKRTSRKSRMRGGGVYEGERKDDMKHGQGKMTWSSGQVYEGEFKDDMKNGQGKMTWLSGEVYEGEFKDDM